MMLESTELRESAGKAGLVQDCEFNFKYLECGVPVAHQVKMMNRQLNMHS